MITVQFGGRRYVYRERSALVELIPNLKFQTPEKFYTDGLIMLLNGQVLTPYDDNGFTIIDDNTIQTNFAITSSFNLKFAYYQKN